jgi:hypothetical protein
MHGAPGDESDPSSAGNRVRMDDRVPFTVKAFGIQIDTCDLLVRDGDAEWISAGVNL